MKTEMEDMGSVRYYIILYIRCEWWVGEWGRGMLFDGTCVDGVGVGGGGSAVCVCARACVHVIVCLCVCDSECVCVFVCSERIFE